VKKIIFVLLPVLAAASLWLAMGKLESKTVRLPDAANPRMQTQLAAVRKLIKDNPKYNGNIVFMLDMKILSGKNRFFVYDLQRDSIVDRGLVAHGSGSETGIYGKLRFSNEHNSLCTSLGKYTIGKSYQGQFGKAYKLSGLDKSNSNAFARNIVLHKFNTMPYEEQNSPIVNSFGCPMVSVKFYDRLQKYIDTSKNEIILDIYY
jgi:hypothetical protein